MKPESLKKIAEALYPSENIDIEEDEVWLMDYPPTTPDSRGHRILATQFDPQNNPAQLLKATELLLKDDWTIEKDARYKDKYMVAIFKNPDFPMFVSPTLTEAVLAAAEELVK